MSLRKEKAARLKIHVLDTTLKLIGKRSFEELFVDDICERVKISKVTLFKYFPQKEDILLYYLRIWCLTRSVELAQKSREGLNGITFLFDRLSEDLEERPGIFLSLVSHLVALKRPPKPFPVKPEEKKLIFPDVPTITSLEIQSIEQMLERFVLEAILRKEITKITATREITTMFLSLFYGGIVSGQLTQQPNAKAYFRKNFDIVVKGLQ